MEILGPGGGGGDTWSIFTSVRRTLYLRLVRAHLGYATQVLVPQGIELISKLESIQRRATKFILCLPFLTNISYKERLMSVNLLPVCYWHELLNLVYFYKATHNMIHLDPSVVRMRVKDLYLFNWESSHFESLFTPKIRQFATPFL